MTPASANATADLSISLITSEISQLESSTSHPLHYCAGAVHVFLLDMTTIIVIAEPVKQDKKKEKKKRAGQEECEACNVVKRM